MCCCLSWKLKSQVSWRPMTSEVRISWWRYCLFVSAFFTLKVASFKNFSSFFRSDGRLGLCIKKNPWVSGFFHYLSLQGGGSSWIMPKLGVLLWGISVFLPFSTLRGVLYPWAGSTGVASGVCKSSNRPISCLGVPFLPGPEPWGSRLLKLGAGVLSGSGGPCFQIWWPTSLDLVYVSVDDLGAPERGLAAIVVEKVVCGLLLVGWGMTPCLPACLWWEISGCPWRYVRCGSVVPLAEWGCTNRAVVSGCDGMNWDITYGCEWGPTHCGCCMLYGMWEWYVENIEGYCVGYAVPWIGLNCVGCINWLEFPMLGAIRWNFAIVRRTSSQLPVSVTVHWSRDYILWLNV